MQIKNLLLIIILSALAIQPALAQNYDDIANAHDAPEEFYGTTRGWDVYAGSRRGRLQYCVAETTEYGTKIRIGVNASARNEQQWQVAIPLRSKPEWEGQLEIDGDSRSASGTAIGEWTIVWLGLSELERLTKGNRAIFDIGRQSMDYSLHGSSAAILKVKECIARDGSPRTANKNKARKKIRKTVSRTLPRKRTVPTRKTQTVSDAQRMGRGCPKLWSIASASSGQPASIEFVYDISPRRAAQIYWLDFQGNPISYARFDGAPVSFDTTVGHVWIIKNADFKCYGGVHTVRPGHNRVVIR